MKKYLDEVMLEELKDVSSISDIEAEALLLKVQSAIKSFKPNERYSPDSFYKKSTYRHLVTHLANLDRLDELKTDKYRHLENVRDVICRQIQLLRPNHSGIQFDDLYQIGYEGYLIAQKSVDPKKGVMTLKYGSTMIGYYLLRFLRGQLKYYNSQSSNDVEFEVDRKSDELTQARQHHTSLSEMALVRSYVGMLPGQEADVITRHFLNLKPETLTSIAKSYNLSKERIRQIKESGLDKIRTFIKEQSR